MSDDRSYAWIGYQDAGSAVHEYNVRDFHVRQVLAEARIATPVKVVRAPYDPTTGMDITPGTIGKIGVVDVQVLVNQVDGVGGSSTPHLTIYAIPYFRYQSALGAIIADPVIGDVGEIIVHDRDTSNVRANLAQANPGSARRNDLADAVYHGVMLSNATPNQGITFTSTGLKIFDQNGNSITMDSNGITITSKNEAGPVTVKGNGKTNVVNTHQHSQGVDSHGDTEANTDAPVPGT